MKRFLHILFTVVCLFIFNTGCGLDVLYMIESPSQIGGTPDQYSQFPDRFFEFRTRESSDIEGLRIIGTDVYYKIYDNLDKLLSDISYINNTDNNSSSKDKLITGGRNYQPLHIIGSNNSILIPYSGSNRNIKIRLTDYQNLLDFCAMVYVSDSSYGIPVRNFPEADNKYSFNFGKSLVNKPISGDNDSNITSNSGNGIYYVSLYAVTVGSDASYSNYYSEPLFLGYVKIDSNYPNEN